MRVQFRGMTQQPLPTPPPDDWKRRHQAFKDGLYNMRKTSTEQKTAPGPFQPKPKVFFDLSAASMGDFVRDTFPGQPELIQKFQSLFKQYSTRDVYEILSDRTNQSSYFKRIFKDVKKDGVSGSPYHDVYQYPPS